MVARVGRDSVPKIVDGLVKVSHHDDWAFSLQQKTHLLSREQILHLIHHNDVILLENLDQLAVAVADVSA